MKNNKFNIDEIAFDIGSLAAQAMIYEVSCFPSPGLVSPVSNGSHSDMNFFTFIDSTAALSKYLVLFVQEGFSDKSCEDIFKNIRAIGIKAEKDMFDKTNRVNTHKGMLFLIGTVCAAVGKVIYSKGDFHDIKNVIKIMTHGIVSHELYNLDKNNDKLTHCEKIFLKYKTEGVRGEVERGIPTVFDFALDFYKKNLDLNINDRLVHTLIGIMQICDDSTIVYRTSEEILEEVKAISKKIIQDGGMRRKKGREEINKLCDEFVSKNISPGGSADLLGVTVFLYLVENYMNELF